MHRRGVHRCTVLMILLCLTMWLHWRYVIPLVLVKFVCFVTRFILFRYYKLVNFNVGAIPLKIMGRDVEFGSGGKIKNKLYRGKIEKLYIEVTIDICFISSKNWHCLLYGGKLIYFTRKGIGGVCLYSDKTKCIGGIKSWCLYRREK